LVVPASNGYDSTLPGTDQRRYCLRGRSALQG
jgi:hypothetical protein